MFEDFIPLLVYTLADVRARLDADANAGLAPTDPEYIDTTGGGFYFDMTAPGALEAARLWDFLATEVPAAIFVQYAWGTYLDEHGVMLGVERKSEVWASGDVVVSGVDGTFIPTGTQMAVPAATPDEDAIIFSVKDNGTIAGGTATVHVVADQSGVTGNVSTGTITLLLTPIPGITSITNPDATAGGVDAESDEDYRVRLVLEYTANQGAGTISDYERWALAYPGVGGVTVEPLWAGAGTVRVIIVDPDHNPASGGTVSGLQAQLDPVAGQGHGLAPIGATVTVATITTTTVTVSATVTHDTGYTLDGTGGTIATRSAIENAIAAYMDSLEPGDDVIRAKVESVFFQVTGVHDVASVLLNGAASNVAVASLQVATLGTVTLT